MITTTLFRREGIWVKTKKEKKMKHQIGSYTVMMKPLGACHDLQHIWLILVLRRRLDFRFQIKRAECISKFAYKSTPTTLLLIW